MEFRRISRSERLEDIWAKIPAVFAASNSAMKDATFSRSQDGTFILQSLLKYPTGVRAIEALRNLGSPPSSLDNPKPPPSVITFLQICVSLVFSFAQKGQARSALLLVKVNWALIEPWITFLLETVVLSQESLPRKDESTIFEYVISFLPILINYPELVCHASDVLNEEIDSLIETDPSLQGRIVRIWLNILYSDNLHPSWRAWSVLFTRLLTSRHVQSSDTPISIPDEVSTQMKVDGRDPDIASRFVLVLVSILDDVPRMDARELRPLRMFLLSITSCFTTDTIIRHIPRRSLRELAMALIEVLSRVLRKQRHLRKLSDISSLDRSSVLVEAHGVVVSAMSIVRRLLAVDETLITDALEAGIVVAMLRSSPCFSLFSAEQERKGKPHVLGFEEIFNHISRSLVHPPTLRLFIRSLSRIRKVKFTSKPTWWDAWENCKRGAFALQTVREKMKLVPQLVCSNEKCAGSAKVPIRRVRCSGCGVAMYCSPHCAKSHWKSGHKNLCRSVQDHAQDGIRPFLSDFDQRFFSEVLQVYASEHSDDLIDVFERFELKSNTQSSAGRVANLKSPILIRNFAGTDLSSVRPYIVTTSFNKVAKYGATKEALENLRRVVDTLKPGQHLFVGTFPGRTSPVVRVIGLNRREERFETMHEISRAIAF